MKEQEPGRLTSAPRNLTLRSEGNSMAIDRGESPPGAGVPVSPEEIERYLRNLYQDALRNRAGRPPGTPGGTPPPEGPREETPIVSPRGERWSPRQKESLLKERKVRDRYFNKIFEIVDAKPHRFFQEAFDLNMQFEHTDFIRLIIDGAKRDPSTGVDLTEEQVRALEEDIDRYEREFRLREAAHNQNAILFLPSVKAEQLFDNMQQSESLLADLAFKTPGVLKMMDIYEEALREEMMQNEGYLKPEAITGTTEYKNEPLRGEDGQLLRDEKGNVIVGTVFTDVEKGVVELRTKKKFKEFVRDHKLTARDKDGNLVVIQPDQSLEDWDINRIFITARAMMIMTGRFMSIAAEGKLGRGLAQYQSLFLQDILQAWSPDIHLLGKYGITESALAAYLNKPDERLTRILGIFHTWDPNTLKETLEKYKDNELAILEAVDEYFYIARQNPNRAGDAFTWQSWRYPTDPEIPGSLKEFILRGRRKMGERWDRTHEGAPSHEDYEEFLKKKEYEIPRTIKKKKAGDKKEVLGGDIKKRRAEGWVRDHPGAPPIEEYEKYANEYINWVGTALRFEFRRSALQYLKPGESSKEFNEATEILEQMVRLQPHRLFLKSEAIRNRITESLFGEKYKFITEAQKQTIDRTLENLHIMETTLLRDRERLLDRGKLFKDLAYVMDTAEGPINYFTEIITNDEDRAFAERFVKAFTGYEDPAHPDTMINGDWPDHKEDYLNEFIYRREYRHGFALWNGDMPLDEFKMSALGPTGSFVRRARDNKYQAEAWGEEVKLLNALKDVHSPDDLIKGFRAIYDKIALYSSDRAKEVMAEKAPGFVKFFAESWKTNLPIVGFLIRQFGKPSFAKIVYGRSAPAFSSTEQRYIYDQMLDKELITEKAHKEITEKAPGSREDMWVDVGVTITQLIAIAFILYMLEKTLKEK